MIKKNNNYFFAIDFIKTFAIASVVLLHIMTMNGSSAFLYDIYASFHIWQAVPLFMLIFGFTFRLSIEKGHSIGKIFSSRLIRLIIPLFIAYFLSFIPIFFLNIETQIDWHILVGKLPTGGMGNYFITLYLETIFYFTILYFLIQNFKKVFVIGFSISLVILGELIAYSIDINDKYMYHSSIHQYALLVVLGYYFYDDYHTPRKKIIFGLGLFSALLIYVFSNYLSLELSPIYEKLKLHHFIYAFYTVMFAHLLVWFYKKIRSTLFDKIVHIIGRSSLHIFLTQIFIFNLLHFYKIEMNILYGLTTMLITFLLGIVWYQAENLLLKVSYYD